MEATQLGVVLCSDGVKYGNCVSGVLFNYGVSPKKKSVKRNLGFRVERASYRTLRVSVSYADSKTTGEAGAEFKPSFGQYLKMMETVKTKRNERRDKSASSDVKDGDLEKWTMEKDGGGVKREKVEAVKKTRVSGVVEAKVQDTNSVVKFGAVGVQKVTNGDEIASGYTRDSFKRVTDVKVRDDEGRTRNNVRWTRDHTADLRTKWKDSQVDREARKLSVGRNQEAPSAWIDGLKTSFRPAVNRSSYDRHGSGRPTRQEQENNRSFEDTSRRTDAGYGNASETYRNSYERPDEYRKSQPFNPQRENFQGSETLVRGEWENSGGFKNTRRSTDVKYGRVNNNDRISDNVHEEYRRTQPSDLRKGKFQTSEKPNKGEWESGGNFKTPSRRVDAGYGKLNQGDKASHEDEEEVDEYGVSIGTERAAFKNMEVIDKGRVSRMLMEERIQRLAKMLNGADIDMPQWMFSKMMRSAQIRYTDHSILRVIQILGKFGNWRRALQVIEWLQMSERFKSYKLRFIYATALDVLGKSKRPVEALNVFTAMLQQMSSYPDIVAYHSIAVTLGRAGHMKELFDVIDCMRSPPKKKFNTGVLEKWDPRLEPDIVVYNAVLNACVTRKQWEGAFWVLQQLNERKIQPSSTTYGLVMEVMYACGKYNLVHEFFEKMQKSFIPNALTYRVLVNTLWKEGNLDEAVSVVNQMESRRIVGSAALYYDLARCLCSMGRCKEALMQMEKICKVANKPLVVTYTGLIQACVDSGNIKDARFIFEKMHGFCSPNLVTYNIMVKAYTDHSLLEDAKELYLGMSGHGCNNSNKSDHRIRVLPDIYTFNTFLDACAAAGWWDDFEYFYTQMLEHGYHFNAKRHLRMILDASRANKGELVETTWNSLAHSGRDPPVSLATEMFCLKMEKNDVAAAISCITSLASDNLVEGGGSVKVGWAKIFKDSAHRFQPETVDRLMNEIMRRQSDLPDTLFGYLMTCCREFIRNSHQLVRG